MGIVILLKGIAILPVASCQLLKGMGVLPKRIVILLNGMAVFRKGGERFASEEWFFGWEWWFFAREGGASEAKKGYSEGKNGCYLHVNVFSPMLNNNNTGNQSSVIGKTNTDNRPLITDYRFRLIKG